MPVIEVKNLNVTYRVLMNKSGSLKELFRDAVKGKARVVDYVAIHDISFTVDKGEVVAILGRNGAGKSTLLKVLAGVLPPTKGTSKVDGKIAPMIELGAGFHPEMTGAENVLFYSALMGRDVKQVKKRTPAIGEWAGVADHMEFPLRTFSSGMVARLAFATATDLTMRVLHVIARLNVGGTARYITQLAHELPKHGIETFVATGFVQGAEVEDDSAQSIDLIRITSMGRSINPIKDHFARKQLDKIIADIKPDIIHTHTFKAGYVIRMKKQPVPVVHTFHGHLLDDPEFSGLKSKVIVQLERKLAKKSVKLVTVGRRVADELLEQNIGERSQFVNIPPGVVPVDVTPKQAALSNLGLVYDGTPLVGWIARVTGVKNPMRALEVADALPDTRFVLAGGGDLLEQVKAAAPANVSVIGWAQAADLFGAADIILSTSENEGMPVALIEAQLAGKPVVATDVGAVSEVILNHETGIVTNKNAGSIASAVESLILDKTTRDEMGRLATARARALFSVERMINAHIELYKSIVK